MKRRDMKSTSLIIIAAVAMSLALVSPTHLAAQGTALQGFNYKVLYTFTGQQDGATPFAGVIRDDAGNTYGTAAQGGNLSCNAPYGCGVVFKIDPSGQQTALHAFTGGTEGALLDGYSSGGVIRDNSGNLYGTAGYGGNPNCPFQGAQDCGLVYKIDSQGNYSVIHAFNRTDGYNAISGLLLGSDGNFYGVSGFGGGNGCGGSGCGLVFKVDPQGNETVLHTFTGGADGAFPGGTPAQDQDGNLYVTPSQGGDYNQGAVFKIDPQGHNWSVLYSFTGGSDGANPLSGVVLDDAGNFYGPTGAGGVNGFGVIFKLDTIGQLTVLHDFTGHADGGLPYGAVIRDAHGNLYGTTLSSFDPAAQYGGVFQLYPGGHMTVLYNFQNTDGAYPYSGLFRDRNGSLYGTTSAGGDLGCGGGGGCGVVFQLSACTTALCHGQE